MIYVTEKENAVGLNGARESQGLSRLYIITMNLRQEANAPPTQVTRIIKTGTTIVMEKGLALQLDRAKEPQDDHD